MQTPTPDLWQGITEVARNVTSIGIIGVFGFLWKVDRRLSRVEQTLSGIDGKNGLVGKVGDLHRWRNDLQQQELERAHEENRRLQKKLDHQQEE